jgi:dUTP pyrophosphatase
MSHTLRIKKLHPDAIVPSFAHPGDAGFDLFASEHIIVKPQERVSVPTGIAVEIGDGYVGLIWDKSGLSHKHGLKTMGGVIDAGYRGEVKVGMINLSNETYTFEKGHKVAQMLIQKIEHPTIELVDELSDSSRGTGGFGSTGK